jgi:hypothetical protein
MEKSRIPRWLVESDPSWEKSIDSNIGMLKWTKKGTGIQATCAPTGMFCDIVGDQAGEAGLTNITSNMAKAGRQASPADDITRYLSSRYLNPGVNGPAKFDLRKLRKF